MSKLPTHESSEPLSYALGLAIALHAKYYPDATQWKPCPDMLGLLLQIDNMTSGLARDAARYRFLRSERLGELLETFVTSDMCDIGLDHAIDVAMGQAVYGPSP